MGKEKKKRRKKEQSILNIQQSMPGLEKPNRNIWEMLVLIWVSDRERFISWRTVWQREMFSGPAPVMLLLSLLGSSWKAFGVRGPHPLFEPTSIGLWGLCKQRFRFRRECGSQSKHSLDCVSWENVDKVLPILFPAAGSQERGRAFSRFALRHS